MPRPRAFRPPFKSHMGWNILCGPLDGMLVRSISAGCCLFTDIWDSFSGLVARVVLGQLVLFLIVVWIRGVDICVPIGYISRKGEGVVALADKRL